MKITANELKVGQRVRTESGETVKITAIRSGDHTPFGKIGRFWHPDPITLFFSGEAHVFAPTDGLEIAE